MVLALGDLTFGLDPQPLLTLYRRWMGPMPLTSTVAPHPFKFGLGAWFSTNRGCGTVGSLGCGSILLAIAGATLFFYYVPTHSEATPQDWFSALLMIGTFSLVAGSGSIYRIRSASALRSEAEGVTQRARARFDEIQNGATLLHQYDAYVGACLDKAEGAFPRQYVGFWKEVEDASEYIGYCHKVQGDLADAIDDYVTILNGRTHDFPEWCRELPPLPDISLQMKRMAELKEQADESYEFTNIRQLRDLQFEVQHGFSSLQAALGHLETAVVDSVAKLKASVSKTSLLQAATPAALRIVAGVFLETRNSGDD